MSTSKDDDYNEKLVKFYNDYFDKDDPELTCKKYSARADKYEEELLYLGYPTPNNVVDIIKQLYQSKQGSGGESIFVLDAGCGTGLVADYLKSSRFPWVIDGFDGAAGMIEIAREKEIYRRLETCFMAKGQESISFPSDEYDLVVACGFFATGLVYPTALAELLRVTKASGHIVFTVGKNQTEEYLAAMKNEISRLVDGNQMKVAKVVEIDYFGRNRVCGYDGIEDSESPGLLKCDVYCCVKC